MKIKNTSIKTFLLLLAAIMFASCGQKKKSPALLLVTSDKMEVYLDGFKRYFDIVNDASDAGKWIDMQRYTIMINREMTEPIKGCFLINVADNGSKNVRIDFIYTTGSQSSNATVVNPNVLSGIFNVNNSIDLVLDGNDARSRATTIASAIYEKLVEIEGE